VARVLITGSTQGLGRAAAETLIADGHRVVVHARDDARRGGLRDLLARGADAVVGDLAEPGQTRALAEQANRLGRLDAIIHNAGVLSGPAVLPVNVVAPYLLTALIDRPARLVYLSSSMHRGGRPDLAGLDWAGTSATASYSDSKLFITTLAAAVARLWPEVRSNAVDPGWVPTRMGGRGATDDLRLGHVTQSWLAVSGAPEAQVTGGYWHHQRRIKPHPAVNDPVFQDRLLDALAEHTGLRLTGSSGAAAEPAS
jgi:NAD(P)-dependent dehydrogenase (short-subunit alcohol dehydrogenase family)